MIVTIRQKQRRVKTRGLAGNTLSDFFNVPEHDMSLKIALLLGPVGTELTCELWLHAAFKSLMMHQSLLVLVAAATRITDVLTTELTSYTQSNMIVSYNRII